MLMEPNELITSPDNKHMWELMSIQSLKTKHSYSPSRINMLDISITKKSVGKELSGNIWVPNECHKISLCLQQWQPTSNVLTVKIIPEAVQQQVISAFRSYFHIAVTEECHQGTHMTYSFFTMLHCHCKSLK